MAEVRAYVAGGHVYCPLARLDRDVSDCLACERFRQIDEKHSPPYLVCDLEEIPQDAGTDPLFVEWWYQHHRRAR